MCLANFFLNHLQATASAADTFEWKHWCFAFMIYGSVFLWIWVSICLHVLISIPICCNYGTIWLRFGRHSGSKLTSKRLGDQSGAWKLSGFKKVYFRGMAAPEKQSRKSCFLDFVYKFWDFFGTCFQVRVFFHFLWIPGPSEGHKSCKNHVGSHKIKVPRLLEKRGSRSRFRQLGVIWEPFGCLKSYSLTFIGFGRFSSIFIDFHRF